MNFVKPNVEVWKQMAPMGEINLQNRQVFVDMYKKLMFQHIERCGRVCYKSEDKLGEKDPKIFVDRMIKSGHLSVLEHGTVYLKDTFDVSAVGSWQHSLGDKYSKNPFSIVRRDSHMDIQGIYITTNYRVIVENGWEEDLQKVCFPTPYHALRITACFTTDIGVSREANRHRKNSISEESTRYCNYSKEKFGAGINYTVPADIDGDTIGDRLYDVYPIVSFKGTKDECIDKLFTGEWDAIDWWLWGLACCEISYLKQIELGRTPQQARRSLPLNTKSTLVHTAFVKDWEHFLDLRSRGTTGAPHPDMKLVADKLLKIMENEKKEVSSGHSPQ